MKEIIYYIKENGRCPYEDWLNKLDKPTRIQILARVNRIIEEEHYGEHRKLTNSPLSELKFKFGKGYRIYFIDLDNIIVLFLAGGDKSGQKDDILKANEYYRNYMERCKNG